MEDNVTLYPNCYTYYLTPLIRKFRALRDDETTSYMKLLEEILSAIAPADRTPAKLRFIKRLHEDCFSKLDLCQMVENSCNAGKKTPMRHFA
jgi:hypothetical protein